VLERKGVIAIDKTSKMLTKVDWQKLADDEMKLLFTAPPLRAALEEVTKKAGVDITSSAQKVAFKGGFKKIVKGYDDAAGSLISGGSSKITPNAATNVAGSVPNFNIPNLNTTALNQAWKVDVAATRAALKAQFPKAPSRDIEIMVQGLSKTKDQATFDIAIKDAVENFKPTYAKILDKPGKRELIRKNWNLLPSWAKTAIGLSATVVGYRAIKAAGIPIDNWLGWLIGGAKEVGGDQYNSAKDELKKGFKKSNDANSSGINPAKDSIIVQPNNTEDPLGLLQNKGGGN
jgi:hypothetical protein